ncbi:MAG TPA: LssY C-terminal domain-containing protein [Bryobacteraceae bacterium]|nr:LssY C-terminal domain-containing protein [Bryobacteraceae bacterium]
MKSGLKVAIFLLTVAGFAAGERIPSGTQLQIRLTQELNTSKAKMGDVFDALVIAPVVVDGHIAMAAGATLRGHVKEATAAVNPDDQAILALAFDEIHDSNGKKASVAAKLSGIDNARETLDSDGRIQGIIASKTGSGRLDQGINKVAEKYPSFADLLGTVKQVVLKDADANIDYKPGVEMTIALTKPLDWTGVSAPPNVAAIEPQDQLFRLVNSEPFRTATEKDQRPSDLTSLMFLGSREQIEDAFQKAGWTPAAKLNDQSKLETFRAMAEMRGYQEAPVSVLLLDGRAPDLVFEKINDTFAARHHLRIWQRPGTFNGKEIWVCSATHDTGISFSEENRTFIHKIDPQIDLERAKVVNDLLLTGLVRALALVERNALPPDMHNATGDALKTDGAMAVVNF